MSTTSLYDLGHPVVIYTVELEVSREGVPPWVYTVDLQIPAEHEGRPHLVRECESTARIIAAENGLTVLRVLSVLPLARGGTC